MQLGFIEEPRGSVEFEMTFSESWTLVTRQFPLLGH